MTYRIYATESGPDAHVEVDTDLIGFDGTVLLSVNATDSDGCHSTTTILLTRSERAELAEALLDGMEV
jgi:hypothetical protein